MAEGGTRKAQLEAADAELQEELNHWIAMEVNPGSVWRMGDQEFHIRCEILALMEILKDRLGVDQVDLDLAFKRIVTKELKGLRPQFEAARREALRRQIVDGIQPMPPRPPYIDPREN